MNIFSKEWQEVVPKKTTSNESCNINGGKYKEDPDLDLDPPKK